MRISDWSSDVCSSDLRQAYGFAELVVVEHACTSGAVLVDMVRQVDRAEVAHGGFLGGRDLEDLGAQVRQVDHVAGPGGLVAGAVAGVLERHPAVAGLRQRADRKSTRLNSSH